jgi:hypothetical protein
VRGRLSSPWRLGLPVAGIGLGLLPLVHGEWRSALVAAVLGQIVVGVWAWGTGCGPVTGTTVGAVLATGMAAAFALSQWPRDGLLRPPASDYLVVWAAGGVVAVAALLVGWRMETGSGQPSGRFAVSGILPWREHRLWFSDEAAQRRRPAPAGSVVVYIDNG